LNHAPRAVRLPARTESAFSHRFEAALESKQLPKEVPFVPLSSDNAEYGPVVLRPSTPTPFRVTADCSPRPATPRPKPRVEHYVERSALMDDVVVYHVRSSSSNSSKYGYSTTMPFFNVLPLARHAVCNADLVEIQIDNKWIPLSTKYQRSKFIEDIVFVQAPPNVKKMNPATFRAGINEGEPAIVRWAVPSSNKTTSTVGRLGPTRKVAGLHLGTYIGTTLEGTCGAMLRSTEDGCFVGFCSIGYPRSPGDTGSVINPEYHIFSDDFLGELKSFGTKRVVLESEDPNWLASYKKKISTMDTPSEQVLCRCGKPMWAGQKACRPCRLGKVCSCGKAKQASQHVCPTCFASRKSGGTDKVLEADSFSSSSSSPPSSKNEIGGPQ
jgi:hypothetical protein